MSRANTVEWPIEIRQPGGAVMSAFHCSSHVQSTSTTPVRARCLCASNIEVKAWVARFFSDASRCCAYATAAHAIKRAPPASCYLSHSAVIVNLPAMPAGVLAWFAVTKVIDELEALPSVAPKLAVVLWL